MNWFLGLAYPNCEDTSGRRAMAVRLVDIQLRKSSSGLPTMGHPKIRIAVARKCIFEAKNSSGSLTMGGPKFGGAEGFRV